MITEEITRFLIKPGFSIKEISQKIEDLDKQVSKLTDSGDYSSPEYISNSKKLSDLRYLFDTLSRAEKLVQLIDDNHKLINSPEFKELAELELEELNEEGKSLIPLLEKLTATPLKDDDKKAIIEIRPGVGGVEASLFAEVLYKVYIRYFMKKGFKIDQYSLQYENEGGIKEAVFLVDEDSSFKDARFESGVHRVQRVPVTESSGRIHTSTALVVIMPQITQANINIKQEDLRIDVYRSSGPGGQSVNTTDSAVRITHIPTGIVVSCQNGKSQHKNKEMAMSILLSKLNEIEEEKKLKEEKDIRSASIQGGDRSVKIRTYNFPQGRITDHRVNRTWYNLSEILDNDAEEMIEEVNAEMRAKIEAS